MSGVRVIVQLLMVDSTVSGLVAEQADGAKGIIAGTLPQGSLLPALSVETISEVDRPELAREGTRLVMERVQVTAFGRNYVQAHDLIKAVKRACAGELPTVTGLESVAVTGAGGGAEGIHVLTQSPSRSFDFRVAYVEAT